MTIKGDTKRFEDLFVPHLEAAYNLARWMTGHDMAAQDIVQESCLRAFRFLHRFNGDHPRAWLLTIVRNQSYTWLKQDKVHKHDIPIDLDDEVFEARLSHGETPEVLAIRFQDALALQKALAQLSVPLREVIILKDLEEMAYKDIAQVIGVPIGTVMSRLSRGRGQLKAILMNRQESAND